MKKLFAILLVAIFAVSFAQAQPGTGYTGSSQNNFYLEAWCPASLEKMPADGGVNLGDFWIPTTAAATQDEYIMWTLTGNSYGLNSEFDAVFTEPAAKVAGDQYHGTHEDGYLADEAYLTVDFDRVYAKPAQTCTGDAVWTDLDNFNTCKTGQQTWCTGEATFKVIAKQVDIAATARPGVYTWTFGVSVTEDTNI